MAYLETIDYKPESTEYRYFAGFWEKPIAAKNADKPTMVIVPTD